MNTKERLLCECRRGAGHTRRVAAVGPVADRTVAAVVAANVARAPAVPAAERTGIRTARSDDHRSSVNERHSGERTGDASGWGPRGGRSASASMAGRWRKSPGAETGTDPAQAQTGRWASNSQRGMAAAGHISYWKGEIASVQQASWTLQRGCV